jgi:hypothetical protein
MRRLRTRFLHQEVELTEWDAEDVASPLVRQLSDAYTATKVPADLYSRIESAARMERFSPSETTSRRVRLFPRIAASGLMAVCLLVAASVLIGHNSAPRAANNSRTAPIVQGPVFGKSHRITTGPSHAPIGVPGLPSRFDVVAAAWNTKSNIIAVGYAVKPMPVSKLADYVFQSPILDWNGRFLPRIGCPPLLGGPFSGYTAYLCFSLPRSVAGSKPVNLVLQAGGLHVRALTAAADVKGLPSSLYGRSAVSVYSRMLHVATAAPARTQCAAGAPACPLSLTVRLKQRVFVDTALVRPVDRANLPSTRPSGAP